MARYPGAPWCRRCSERPFFRRSIPMGHGETKLLRNKSEYLEKSESLEIIGSRKLCRGSHSGPDDEDFLTENWFHTKNNPEKSKVYKKFILEKENSWELKSSSEEEEEQEESQKSWWPLLPKLSFNYQGSRSPRPKKIITTLWRLKPCELDNPHINWEPPTTTNENWDIIDLSTQDADCFFPYEGQFDDYEVDNDDNIVSQKLVTVDGSGKQ